MSDLLGSPAVEAAAAGAADVASDTASAPITKRGGDPDAENPPATERPTKRQRKEGQRQSQKKQKGKRQKGGKGGGKADAAGKDVVARVVRGLRWIEPYHHAFTTHAKGRWIGRQILEVFAEEFKSETREAYADAIAHGRITVNGKPVQAGTVLCDNDFIRNTAHRHEPPVIATAVKIVHEDDNVVAVDKPPSVPVHACGRYRYNTVQSILERENGKVGLLPCHRLDRLTSGVLIFAKTQGAAKRVQTQIQGHLMRKVYVCRVRGAFPAEPIVCSASIKVVNHKLGVCSVAADGKQCETSFTLLRHLSDGTSVVRCEPKTGRMHQIRVHLQHLGFPIDNDPV